MKKRSRGRPRTVEHIRAVPVFREKPDVAKLGRAVIAMAELMAKAKSKTEAIDENQG